MPPSHNTLVLTPVRCKKEQALLITFVFTPWLEYFAYELQKILGANALSSHIIPLHPRDWLSAHPLWPSKPQLQHGNVSLNVSFFRPVKVLSPRNVHHFIPKRILLRAQGKTGKSLDCTSKVP